MKRWVLAFGALLLFSAVASAQDENPNFEAFGGYSYIRANLGHSIPGINLNGGSGSFSYNPTGWLGLVADFGGYHAGHIGSLPVDGTVFTYLFGPKITYRSGRWTPFAQALFGGAHASGSVSRSPGVITGAVVRPQGFGIPGFTSGTSDAFAMAIGGGVDFNATNHIGFRLVQAEYLMTRFSSETQNNARVSAGVVFRF